MLPFNFIFMENLCTINSKNTLLNFGSKLGHPISIKNNPIFFDIRSNKNNSTNCIFYNKSIYSNIITSYVLLLCMNSGKHTIQNLVVSSTVIKNLSSCDINNLKEPYFMFGNQNIWKPIINCKSSNNGLHIFLPKYHLNTIKFLNNKAINSYNNLIEQCFINKITLKISKGDLLLIDNKSVLLSTDGFYDSKKLYKCLFIL